MTTDLHPFPFDGGGPAHRRRWPNPAAMIAAALCAASCTYAAILTATDGWLATTKAWLAWPTYTLINFVAMLAALASAWLAGRELSWRSGDWTALNAAVLVVSVVLCLAFIVSLLVAAVVALLSASDDESEHRIRLRSGSRQRRRSKRSRNRRRASHRNRRRRYR